MQGYFTAIPFWISETVPDKWAPPVSFRNRLHALFISFEDSSRLKGFYYNHIFTAMDKFERKLLTIVIPVYKVEKYIRQCLDSIIVPLDQMEKLEVIIVNDGTPDNSAVIAHEYADRYPDTIKVIDKENGGHGSAWNVGLESATGKYIRFLDSDD